MTQPTQPINVTAPASAYGVTLWTGVNQFGRLDVDPSGLTVTGLLLVAQRLVLRQTTPLDSCADAPNDCFDLRDWLSCGMTDTQVAQLPGLVQNELQKDVAVQSASVSLVFTPSTATLILTENVQTAQGPFSLVLTVTPSQVSFLVNQITGGA